MNNNDVLRRLRYALDLSNARVAEAFTLGGTELGRAEVAALLKKEGEEGFLECGDAQMQVFLDGFIVARRGKREQATAPPSAAEGKLSNNDILKKLRIALELKEADLLDLFKLAGFPTSRGELTALFRAPGQENYKPCGDQMLRSFLKGLTLRYRGGDRAPSSSRPSR